MNMDPYIRKIINKQQGFSFDKVEDYIAVEKKLVISFQGKEFISLYCTPVMIKELITGFLLTAGILTNKIALDKMKIVYGDDITVNISSDIDILTERFSKFRCLGGFSFLKKHSFEKIHDDFSLTIVTLKNLFNDFQERSNLFKLTGCFHSAAISDSNSFLSFAEDIGRHNCVDKVIGDFILKDISFKRKIMLVSCRISSEIISKCSICGIAVLASISAPTDLAIEIAETSGITLVGFVRKDQMNIYTNSQRIQSE